MSLQVLEKIAQRDRARSTNLGRLRAEGSWRSFVHYALWRSYLPLLARFTARAFLLVELGLLAFLFHIGLVADLSLAVFLLLIGRACFSDISQSFRVKLIELRRKQAEERSRKTIEAYLIFAGGSGIVCGAIFFALLLALPTSSVSMGVALTWAALLPVEFGTASLWTSVYTRSRLRRRFSVTLLAQALPSLMLISCHSFLGIYAYVIGVAAGRLLECGYLAACALIRLKQLRLRPFGEDKGRDWIFSLLTERRFLVYASLLLPLELYNFVLAVALYIRSEEYWLAHFIFMNLVLTFTYFGSRVAKSLKMDIYQALYWGKLLEAERYKKQVEVVTILVSILLMGVLVGMYTLQAVFPIMVNHFVDALWFYLILCTLARSLFGAELTVHQAGGSEYSLRFISLSFLVILVPLQLWIIFVLRGNLQAVYLADAVGYLVLAGLLFGIARLHNSRVLVDTLRGRMRSGAPLQPSLWLSYVRGMLQKGEAPTFVVVEIHQRYCTPKLRIAFLKKLVPELGPSALCCRIVERTYIFALSAPPARSVPFKFGGHLCSYVICAGSSPLEATEFLVQKLCINQGANPEFAAIVSNARTALESKARDQVSTMIDTPLKDLSLHPVNEVRALLSAAGFDKVPCVYLTGDRLLFANNPSGEHINAATDFNYTGSLEGVLCPKPVEDYCQVVLGGRLVALVSSRGLKKEERRELRALTILASLCLTWNSACSLKLAHRSIEGTLISSALRYVSRSVEGQRIETLQVST